MKINFSYSHWDMLLASTTEPLPKQKRDYQLKIIKACLANIERAPEVTPHDLEVVSNAVDMMQTLLKMGLVADEQDAIGDAFNALSNASKRHFEKNMSIRLNGPDIVTLRGVLEDYEMVLENLPARTMIAAHRATEKRIQEELAKVPA
jgi:enamine deaminase RidA (YjgF/YER057c/UK114 family)